MGGQHGIGTAVCLELMVVWLGEFTMCAEATAPVTTRDRAKARMRFFMVWTLSEYIYSVSSKVVRVRPDEVTLGLNLL